MFAKRPHDGHEVFISPGAATVSPVGLLR